MLYRSNTSSSSARDGTFNCSGSACYVPAGLQRPASRATAHASATGPAAPLVGYSSTVGLPPRSHHHQHHHADVYTAPPLKMSSQITAASATSTPLKSQRRPLGDATFITQVSRTPTAQQYSPVKMPPTPSRAPAVQQANASLLRPHVLQHHRPLLVLDLDETLVHASVEASDGNHDVAFVVEMNQQRINVFVKVRPFAREFLRRVGQLFEVCVFTASLSPYADRVVDYLDPAGQFVHHRLYREHCTNVDGNYVKDMSLMGRSLERVAIVDNSPIAYTFHPENAIPILSWFDDRSDKELVELMPMLEHFAQTQDFSRTRRKFKVNGAH